MTDRTATLLPYLGIFARGLLMGAADIVPGVSGGTVAFVTGIYDRLLTAISAVDHHWLALVLRGRFGAAYRAVDGSFLLALVLGIGTSIGTLARLINWLLVSHPVLLWAFFFGLIAGSALALLRHVARWTAATAAALAAGTALALAVAVSPAVQLDGGTLALFCSGFIAICAMILPGVSGSFILVLLGMYSTVLGAVETRDVAALAVFATGAACGLLTFARLLHFLLARYHQPAMALLTGFLLGSLLVVWPWKLAVNDGAAAVPIMRAVTPAQFAHSGQDALLAPSVALMLGGLLLVWLIERRWGVRGG